MLVCESFSSTQHHAISLQETAKFRHNDTTFFFFLHYFLAVAFPTAVLAALSSPAKSYNKSLLSNQHHTISLQETTKFRHNDTTFLLFLYCFLAAAFPAFPAALLAAFSSSAKS
jgi:hypothetical protein